eukprot:6291287-Prymnesium_polylepis.1
MGVFSQMLGEGIAMSSLPLYLTRLGAEPLLVGVAISCFSVAQMIFAPIMVRLSTRVGRSLVLRVCIAGAAASSLLIALSGNVYGVVAGRTLAGVFAACVPVAQSAVTDILPRDQTALGLSRVSAASQLGVVVGPAASALFQAAFAAAGLPSEQCLPAVFVVAAAFAVAVLAQMALLDRRTLTSAAAKKATPEAQPQADRAPAPAEDQVDAVRLAQPMLRLITIIIGWTAVLSNSIYGLFAPRFMGGLPTAGEEDGGTPCLHSWGSGCGDGHRGPVGVPRPAAAQLALHAEPGRGRCGRYCYGRLGCTVFGGHGSPLPQPGLAYVDQGCSEDIFANPLEQVVRAQLQGTGGTRGVAVWDGRLLCSGRRATTTAAAQGRATTKRIVATRRFHWALGSRGKLCADTGWCDGGGRSGEGGSFPGVSGHPAFLPRANRFLGTATLL